MYCSECGTELIYKDCINFGISDGVVPFCPKCSEFKFKRMNIAVSAVIFNPELTKILLIQQYGNRKNILVAGYVSAEETLEHALVREIKEETNLDVESFYYNQSEYFAKSESLICNFIVVAKNEKIQISQEVDYADWYDVESAAKVVYRNPQENNTSLAHKFLNLAVAKVKQKILCC
ncbi:MAG: NAD(+) diphosphatase [Candidatus Gastranaerophilaceae bacterium]